MIIVGGGINGAGIARDAARRGMSVALFEKRDFGVGATGNSSGMIHGGLRYLLRDPGVTKLACIDSGYIQKIASNLIFRIPFIMPVLGKSFSKRAFLKLSEVYFEAYDRYQPYKQGKKHCRLDADELRQMEPGVSPHAIGGVTTDEWGIDAARLNALNALDAAEQGAEVRTYREITELIHENGHVRGVRVRDRITGDRRDFFGKLILNAAGAWSNQLAKMAGIKRPLVRPSKGIHLVYPGRLTNYAIVSHSIDGRQIFICPHQNETWLGTTDDDYWGDMDDVPVVQDEIQYLIDGIERVFPSIRQYRAYRTLVGVRPTLYEYGPFESKLSREHELYDHAEEGAAGLLTIAGGKLASYRIISEEVTDDLARRLGVNRPCETHTEPLPGGEAHDLEHRAFTELGVDAYTADRILFRHGARAERVLDLMRREPRTRAIICPCEPVTEAELRIVLRDELARTLDDCRRRCRLGVGPCGGAECSHRAAQIYCQERGLSAGDAHDVARSFAANGWRDRQATLFDHQLAQEEISQSWFFLSGLIGAANTRPIVTTPGEPAPSAGEEEAEQPPSGGAES